MQRRIVLVGLLSAIGFCACVAWAREWCDATGQYKIEATFVGFKDGKVQLKKPNGDTISVALSRLREEDQKFVMEQVMRHAKEAEADTPKAQPTASADAPKTQPATSAAAPQEAMFEVVKTEIVEKPVEVNGCRVTPKSGCVLYVCTVNFTKTGLALSHEALSKLKIAPTSKNLSKKSTQGNVISRGDFCLRLDNDTTVPCYCLPVAEGAQGLPVRPARARGGENWLMYCGNVRFLASLKPDVKPESLVWGGAYEVKIVPMATAAAKQPAKTVVAQAPQTPAANPSAASAPAAKAAPPPADPAAAARAADAAMREQHARRAANLNKGVLRTLLGKHPELEAMGDFGRQLVIMDELWDDKDQFNHAAFETYLKQVRGGK